MRRRTLKLIAAKELLDTLRDRRTLFVALVLPLLLYPALLLGLTQVIGATQRNLQKEEQKVLVDGIPAELVELMRQETLAPVEAALAPAVAPLCEAPLEIDALALVRQDAPEAAFALVERFPLAVL